MIKTSEKLVQTTKGELVKLIEVKEEIPKEFRWILHLKALCDRGFILKYFYRIGDKIEEQDTLKYFELDSEGQSYVPVKPAFVKVFQYREGAGFVEVAELHHTRNFVDPELPIAMKIWDIVRGM